MKLALFFVLIFVVGFGIGGWLVLANKEDVVNTPENKTLGVKIEKPKVESKPEYWMVLHRKSNREQLFYGDKLVREFQVNSGVAKKTPTPLHDLLDRDYWLITAKRESSENPETAPYFLSLDIPGWEISPFGPTPYLECGEQCDWVKKGEFGLHGVGSEPERLFDGGSGGCVRHKNEDIAYLYNLLNPEENSVKYFVIDD